MKRVIKNIRTENTINSAIDAMLELEDLQEDGLVGIFWYDAASNDLFGVESEIASRIPFYHSDQFGSNVRTGGKLHKQVWKKEFHKGRDSRFTGNYTQVPRGRVFEFENDGFKVYVGDWISKYPSAKQLIIDEFELPTDTEFVIDTHWDLGHGWSEEYL